MRLSFVLLLHVHFRYAFGSSDFARSVAKDPFGFGVAKATEKYTSTYGKDSQEILREQQEVNTEAEADGTLGDAEQVLLQNLAKANRLSEKM